MNLHVATPKEEVCSDVSWSWSGVLAALLAGLGTTISLRCCLFLFTGVVWEGGEEEAGSNSEGGRD